MRASSFGELMNDVYSEPVFLHYKISGASNRFLSEKQESKPAVNISGCSKYTVSHTRRCGCLFSNSLVGI